MTPEQDRCIQIGWQNDSGGYPISQEYLLTLAGGVYTIEVVGVPLHPSLNDINREKIPPFAVPAEMLRDPAKVCEFILAAPFSSLKNHLVQQEDLP